MRTALFTTLLVVALTAVVSTQTQPAEFRVVYYPDAAVAAGFEGGVLEIEREVFRFRPDSGQVTWTVDLGNVESITVEPFAGPFRTVSSIVIECVENNPSTPLAAGRKVRRRIAAVDDISLTERAMLTGMMRLRVEQFKAARAAASRQ
jgi:hypothetical protein